MTTRRRRGQVVPCPRLFVHRLIFFPLFFAPRRHEVEEEATQRRGGGEVALVPARSCDAIFLFPSVCSPTTRRRGGGEVALVPVRSCGAIFCSPFFAPRRHDVEEEEPRLPVSLPVSLTEATRRRGGGEVALVPARSCGAIFLFPFFCSPTTRRRGGGAEAALVPARQFDRGDTTTRRRRGRPRPRPFVRCHFCVPLFFLPDDTTSRRRLHDDKEEARLPPSSPVRAKPLFCSPFFAPCHDDEEEAT
jgi:hypothetical protein